MKNFITFFLVIILSNVASAKVQISELVENAINKTDPNLNIGIKVKNLVTGKIVYEKNSRRYFIV